MANTLYRTPGSTTATDTHGTPGTVLATFLPNGLMTLLDRRSGERATYERADVRSPLGWWWYRRSGAVPAAAPRSSVFVQDVPD